MKEALNLYENLGVTQVNVEAADKVGKYAWAKYGFIPESLEEANSLADQLMTALSGQPRRFPSGSTIHKDLTRYIAKLRKDPKAIRDIADYSPSVTMPDGKLWKAGKALMLSYEVIGWRGKADLTDWLTVDQWIKYCNSKSSPAKESRHMPKQSNQTPRPPRTDSTNIADIMYEYPGITLEKAEEIRKFREYANANPEDPIADSIELVYGPNYKGVIHLEGYPD